jgi:hypothetical protein
MGSIFYIVGVLNALYIIMLTIFILSAGVFGGNLICDATDDDDSWMDEKEKRLWKKSKKISLWACGLSVLWVLFVPSGDTYLKMKIADKVGEERVEDIFDLLDKKLTDAVDAAELIDYE